MVFSLGRLKIRDQIFLLTLPLLFVLLTAIGFFLYAYWLVAHTTASVEQSHESVTRTEALLQHATEMDMGIRGFILTDKARALHDYEAAAAAFSRDFAVLQHIESHDPVQTAELEGIHNEVRAWERRWAEGESKRARAGRVPRVGDLKGSEAQFSKICGRLNQLLEGNRRATALEMRASEQAMRRALVLGVVVVLLFGALLLFISRLVIRMIAQPVQQLIEASDRVSRGDFEPVLPPTDQNEFGILSESFGHMIRALREEREELSALKRFSEVVTQCTSENEVYDHLLHSLEERFHPRQVIIFKLRPEEDFLEAVATLVPLPPELREWPVMEGKHSCKAVRMGRPFRVNDVGTEPLCPGKFALPGEGSYYCGPLIAGGIIIGAVRLEAACGFWTPERESLLESYLSSAATALSNLRLLQTMRERANIDPLTGLYNRRFCEDYARKLMAMARRKNQPLGFIMMDLDRFKTFNDVYGHEVGDRILRQFAKTVTQAMRETNLTARFGGEEFVVLLPDTGAQACEVVAERIRKAVAHMTVPSGGDKPLPHITLSLGIAVYPDHGASLDEVLQASDRALYDSKHAGRNRTTVFVEEAESSA